MCLGSLTFIGKILTTCQFINPTIGGIVFGSNIGLLLFTILNVNNLEEDSYQRNLLLPSILVCFLPEITVKTLSENIINSRIECKILNSTSAIPIYPEAFTSHIPMGQLVTEIDIQQSPVNEVITRN